MQLNSLLNKQIEQNRQKLLPVVGAVILCGRQNIALRGHRDGARYFADGKNNPGNMQEILKFLAKFGNNALFEDHMDNAAKSATYRSKTTQNELIAVCGELILSKLVSQRKQAQFFSMLADKAADVSKTEQVSLVIRFVVSGSEIRETFLGFIPCDDRSCYCRKNHGRSK